MTGRLCRQPMRAWNAGNRRYTFGPTPFDPAENISNYSLAGSARGQCVLGVLLFVTRSIIAV